jgi:hypothetical protein
VKIKTKKTKKRKRVEKRKIKKRERDFREDAHETVVLVLVLMAYIILDFKSHLVLCIGGMEVPLCVILG